MDDVLIKMDDTFYILNMVMEVVYNPNRCVNDRQMTRPPLFRGLKWPVAMLFLLLCLGFSPEVSMGILA